MSYTQGFKGKLEVSFDGGKNFQSLSGIKSLEATTRPSPIDTTSWDDRGSSSSITGIRERKLSVEGFWNAQDFPQTALENAIEDGEDLIVRYFRDSTLVQYHESRAMITSLKLSSPVDGVISYSVEFQRQGVQKRLNA